MNSILEQRPAGIVQPVFAVRTQDDLGVGDRPRPPNDGLESESVEELDRDPALLAKNRNFSSLIQETGRGTACRG